MISNLMVEEFAGNLEKVSFQKKVKFDFKLKSRSEHLKAL